MKNILQSDYRLWHSAPPTPRHGFFQHAGPTKRQRRERRYIRPTPNSVDRRPKVRSIGTRSIRTRSIRSRQMRSRHDGGQPGQKRPASRGEPRRTGSS